MKPETGKTETENRVYPKNRNRKPGPENRETENRTPRFKTGRVQL
jgi:hypothetical protein